MRLQKVSDKVCCLLDIEQHPEKIFQVPEKQVSSEVKNHLKKFLDGDLRLAEVIKKVLLTNDMVYTATEKAYAKNNYFIVGLMSDIVLWMLEKLGIVAQDYGK